MAETSTIILADDGRFVGMGRYSEPSQAEIATAAEALAAQGLGGWLATMAGTYYSKRGKVALTEMQKLGAPCCSFAEAEARFHASRKVAVSG